MKSESANKKSSAIKPKSPAALRAKPFLKWAGGKGQLLETFSGFYPPELKTNLVENYYEPFVGGGAVFFDIAQKYTIKSALLCDVNEELILTYQVVQKDVFKLMEHLEWLKKRYEKPGKQTQQQLYYEVRDEFNNSRFSINHESYSDKWIKRAAQVIFLNKTCFNGLFRFNSKGAFNVPAGRYKNPKILDEQNLVNASKLLLAAEIRKADFKEITGHVKPGSFVYFDPPYRPLNHTSSFTAYSKNAFADTEQIALAALFTELNQKGAKLMLSNSDPKNTDPNDHFFDELYKPFHIFRISAKRSINSNAAKRNAINEIIVTNYPV